MTKLQEKLLQPASIAPLVIFRLIFGGMMFASTLRFILKGWVQQLYLEPQFFFKYYGFSWVEVPGETGLWLLFGLMLISSLGIMLGAWYRLSAFIYFLSFTYVELLDLSNYLNHYYFVSLVALLMIFLPAHRAFSVDVWRKPALAASTVPFLCIGLIRLQLGIVYFYAGLAKLHPDWLLEAQPLRLWLSARPDLPLIGSLLGKVWVAFLFSWFGAIYDLSIPFLLSWKRTRLLAYAAVVVFHVLTWLLFPIGMFPWIMILSTLIFFPAGFHQKIISALKKLFRIRLSAPARQLHSGWFGRPLVQTVLAGFIIFQLVFPFRFALYPGNMFWTEQGFRFSWRVMLIEKAGSVYFRVRNPETGHTLEVQPQQYLTPLQEKMMATQPDMILQFAHFLAKEYEKLGIPSPEVYAEAYSTLNGRRSSRLIDPTVDLAKQTDSFAPKSWILPLDESPRVAKR